MSGGQAPGNQRQSTNTSSAGAGAGSRNAPGQSPPGQSGLPGFMAEMLVEMTGGRPRDSGAGGNSARSGSTPGTRGATSNGPGRQTRPRAGSNPEPRPQPQMPGQQQPPGPERERMLSMLMGLFSQMIAESVTPEQAQAAGIDPENINGYEDFLRLAEMIGPARARYASREAVDAQLPTVRFTRDVAGEETAGDDGVEARDNTAQVRDNAEEGVVLEPLHDADEGDERIERPSEVTSGDSSTSPPPPMLGSTGDSGIPPDTGPSQSQTQTTDSQPQPTRVEWGLRDLMSATKESCTICLDSYAENDELRILRCKHGFHSECIDRWLLNNVNSCPICREPGTIQTQPMAESSGSNEQPFPFANTPFGMIGDHGIVIDIPVMWGSSNNDFPPRNNNRQQGFPGGGPGMGFADLMNAFERATGPQDFQRTAGRGGSGGNGGGGGSAGSRENRGNGRNGPGAPPSMSSHIFRFAYGAPDDMDGVD
ncbi:hypothetical protein HDU76_013395 [Blyttiomyces sp. JEL0837]|nr:hypothetical protein HDU76_013395 [Blyttiomyces sp. JEL0837]